MDPYTNIPFREEDIIRVNEEHRLAQLLKRRAVIKNKAESEFIPNNLEDEGSINSNLTHIVMTICSKLDSLGHISNPQWFLNLTTEEWRRLNNTLSDIWIYRAQLSPQVRMAIGGRINLGFLLRRASRGLAIRTTIANIRRLILRDEAREHHALGAMYVLIALTQVSQSAADAMPALYQAGRL